MRMTRACDEEDHPLSERGIEQQNEALLRRYRELRRGADAVTAAWRGHPEVIAVSLIGSVARAPWKAQTARTCIDGHLEEHHVNDPAVSHLEMDDNVPGREHELGRPRHAMSVMSALAL